MKRFIPVILSVVMFAALGVAQIVVSPGAVTDTCTGNSCAIGGGGISTDGGVTFTAGHLDVGIKGITTDGGVIIDSTFANAGLYVTDTGTAKSASVVIRADTEAQLTLRTTSTAFLSCVSSTRVCLAATGQYQSSQSTGNTAFGATVNGARFDFGAGANDYASSDGTTVTFAGPLATAGTLTSTGNVVLGTTATLIAAKPTLTGFGGTGPSITGTGASFVVDVGTVAPGSTGTLTFATTATNGYNCSCYNESATPLTQTKASADTATTCVITNYTVATGVAANWTASDKVHCIAAAY